MANRVHNKGTFRQEEAYASEAGIYPGMLITLDSSDELAIHAVEGGELGDESMFAMEDALQGETIDDVYVISTLVTYIIPNLGSVVNALVEVDQDVSIGDKMCSAGNGKLKVISDLESGETLAKVVGIAEEACDLTGSGAEDTLCAIRIS